ncbi:hypothetical protein GCM10022600_15200 [Qipengyuania pelagi]|uniref:Peptidase S24/S26A/S26B/S26C domain-containing protein n=1 Tax=Qipengyuania pelagi TaxID=994320 RepID=A0A844Y627_9SPHN|nr:helix-turn-helix transcriptional regulator [Qipengyuania pelagi]MXO53625.1 hypothetical protein [Qipengyuania pelagi]
MAEGAAKSSNDTGLFDRIEPLMADLGISARELSLRITGKPDLVRDIRRKGHKPNADNLHAMANELGTTVEYLMGGTDDAEQVFSEVGVSDTHVDWRGSERVEPGIPLVGTGDCADLEVCDTSGQMVRVERSSFDSDYHVRMIARPPALRGARDLYAIYFHGESMEPRFAPGEVGIVDPGRPVRSGDYVVVQINTGDSDEVATVLVKRLIAMNAREITLEQFNPALTFTLERTRIARIHRILPQTELLFG